MLQSFDNTAGEDKYVVFFSGLSVGSNMFNPLQFQLLVDHITGHLGDENVCIFSLRKLLNFGITLYFNMEQEQSIASQIVRVVIAGNSVQLSHVILNGQVKWLFIRYWNSASIKDFFLEMVCFLGILSNELLFPSCYWGIYWQYAHELYVFEDMQTLTPKDQSRLTEPIKEFDISLIQVLILIIVFLSDVHFQNNYDLFEKQLIEVFNTISFL